MIASCQLSSKPNLRIYKHANEQGTTKTKRGFERPTQPKSLEKDTKPNLTKHIHHMVLYLASTSMIKPNESSRNVALSVSSFFFLFFVLFLSGGVGMAAVIVNNMAKHNNLHKKSKSYPRSHQNKLLEAG